jgi:DNA-binding Lrp family transcriptional regulator
MDTTDLKARLLDVAQRDFPLTPRPYKALADRLGVAEYVVIAAFREMTLKDELISRIGAVYRTGTVGASCLAALAVPEEDLEKTAEFVGTFPEVNHNYRRDHPDWTLWFVVTAPDTHTRDAVLDRVEADTGLPLLRLPMLEAYHLDLGFPLR